MLDSTPEPVEVPVVFLFGQLGVPEQDLSKFNLTDCRQAARKFCKLQLQDFCLKVVHESMDCVSLLGEQLMAGFELIINPK